MNTEVEITSVQSVPPGPVVKPVEDAVYVIKYSPAIVGLAIAASGSTSNAFPLAAFTVNRPFTNPSIPLLPTELPVTCQLAASAYQALSP